jgi:hypothetical protein
MRQALSASQGGSMPAAILEMPATRLSLISNKAAAAPIVAPPANADITVISAISTISVNVSD